MFFNDPYNTPPKNTLLKMELLKPAAGSVNPIITSVLQAKQGGQYQIIKPMLENPYVYMLHSCKLWPGVVLSSPLLDGVYCFVETKDHQIRIWPNQEGRSLHACLLDTADMAVLYAGTVKFQHNYLAKWNNRSGYFQPSAQLSHQASFPQDKFEDESLTY